MLNKSIRRRRLTSVRLEEDGLDWLRLECNRLDISIAQALNWLIQKARERGRLSLPGTENEAELQENTPE